MSVIIKNCLDESYRFFIKGAPEKIYQLCAIKSLPVNFEEIQMNHTKNGYRVLACATKLIPYKETYFLEENRTKYENNLSFLGFIIFKHKLSTRHMLLQI